MARTDGTSALKRDGRLTLAEWRAWPEGVREYWIIHPDTRSVFRYQRSGERFAPLTEFRRGEAAASVVFEGFAWGCP